ncbi:hypothetical protein [Thauera sp.]|uniref:hypothetical protein n=1 Tax=Thauera sp. TaxID=1905334 RepID=UPI0039E3BA5C
MFSRILNLIRRARLAMAESDLQFLEARAPIAIEAQRELVSQRRAALGLPAMPCDAETVRREVEHRAKWGAV